MHLSTLWLVIFGEMHGAKQRRVGEAPTGATADSPVLPDTATTRAGWAPSFGATVPVRLTVKDDTASIQATYAVNALQYLGTKADIPKLEAIIPTSGSTSGWSVVASFHHPWTKQLE